MWSLSVLKQVMKVWVLFAEQAGHVRHCVVVDFESARRFTQVRVMPQKLNDGSRGIVFEANVFDLQCLDAERVKYVLVFLQPLFKFIFCHVVFYVGGGFLPRFLRGEIADSITPVIGEVLATLNGCGHSQSCHPMRGLLSL